MSDDYLWDRSGTPDPVVRALEDLLAPLGHEGRGAAGTPTRAAGMAAEVPGTSPGDARAGEATEVGRAASPDDVATAEPPVRVLSAWRSRFLAAAAALLVCSAAWLDLAPGPAPTDEIALRVRGREGVLASGQWFVATEGERELELGDVGRLTLVPGSRLRVRRLEEEQTDLYLARGEMEALVSADARPRFFQVGTPATTCIDLGCRYTLRVDESGNSVVVVHTGQVAFENEGCEVFVPADATCRASRGVGAGTPRFLDTPAPLAAAIDAFDAARGAHAERRRVLARAVLAAIDTSRHTLAAWHFLQDRDAEIVAAAEGALARVAGRPAGLTGRPGTRPSAEDRETWKDHLYPAWW